MKRTLKMLSSAAVVAGVVGAAVVSMATHNEPQKAGKFSSDVVTAYARCAYPGNSTTSNGFPACTPAARFSGATCEFGTKGKGKVSAKVKSDAAGIKGLCPTTCKGCDTISKPCVPAETCDTGAVCQEIKLSGINLATCPAGTVLTSSTIVNASSNDCGPGGNLDCTVTVAAGGSLPLVFGFPTVSCTVDTKGNCKVKGTVNGVVPNTLNTGKAVGLEVRDVFLVGGAGTPEFAAGVLIP
jgi:hypothetical protein